MNKDVLILGGGISGISMALDIAQSGYTVNLIEREPYLGGWVATYGCKATEKCNQCSVCLLPAKIEELRKTTSVSIYLNTELERVEGNTGNFTITLKKKPPFLDSEKCIACGICMNLCPNKAIRLSNPNYFPSTYILERQKCLHFKDKRCKICVESCSTGAINFNPTSEEFDLHVGAIGVATGFEPYRAQQKAQFGFPILRNVITGSQMESKLSLEGRDGFLLNGKPPARIAFIQCVGSRDPHINRNYCSTVCCAYALRTARRLKKEFPETQITIFYIDIQSFGKDFLKFLDSCKNEDKMRFVKGIPASVEETDSGLMLRYEDILEGKITEEIFDLVILSVGISPREDASLVARRLGINMSSTGFFDSHSPLNSNRTNVPGIFVAGTCQGPRNINESILHAKAAATNIIAQLERVPTIVELGGKK